MKEICLINEMDDKERIKKIRTTQWRWKATTKSTKKGKDKHKRKQERMK